MTIASITIKRKAPKNYQKSNLCYEELICKLLKMIQKEEQISKTKLRMELGTNQANLGKYLETLRYCQAIIQLERKFGSKTVTCFSITEKGNDLILKYDILLALLPLVWRGEDG